MHHHKDNQDAADFFKGTLALSIFIYSQQLIEDAWKSETTLICPARQKQHRLDFNHLVLKWSTEQRGNTSFKDDLIWSLKCIIYKYI